MAQRPFLKGTTVDVSQVLKHLHSDCYFSKKEAADYLNWSMRKLGYCLAEIPHFKHRGRVYFKRSGLDHYMAGFEVRAGMSEEIRLRKLADETLAKMEGA